MSTEGKTEPDLKGDEELTPEQQEALDALKERATIFISTLKTLFHPSGVAWLQGFLAIAGLTLYGIARLSSETFYGQFQVTLPEVGIGFNDLILPALMLLVMLALPVLTLALLSVMMTYALSIRRITPFRVAGVSVLMVVAVLVFIHASVVIGANEGVLNRPATGLILGTVYITVGASYVVSRPVFWERPEDGLPARYAVYAATSFAVAAFVAAAAAGAVLLGDNLALEVESGRPIAGDFQSVFGLDVPVAIPVFRAVETAVAFTDETGEPIERCMLYLGSSDGIHILYDHEQDATLRIAAENASLSGICR